MTTLRLVLVTLVACAGLYPLLVLGLARVLAPAAAEGSLLRAEDGTVIGSRLVAQGFTRDDYLWPRPSAVGYDATAAGGSNLASTDPALRARAESALVRLAGSADATASAPLPVPQELVTASGSGLDPHLTLAGALVQAPRIARARRVSASRVSEVLRQLATAPSFGRPALVVVLEANLALDRELGRAPVAPAAAEPP